jgi:hypothetical protein
MMNYVTSQQRLAIATIKSDMISSDIPQGNIDKQPMILIQDNTEKKNIHSKTLRLGFISFDFNDHPTAHLVEGIFAYTRQIYSDMNRKDNCDQISSIDDNMKCDTSTNSQYYNVIELYIYNYGKNDNSVFRNSLMKVQYSTAYIWSMHMSIQLYIYISI